MSSRAYELFLFDIFIAISKIEIVSSKFTDANDLLHDFVSWDSIIREFEIIGEATNIAIKNGLIDNRYRVVVDFRNKIIHHYFGIDPDAVWSIVHSELPSYKTYIIEQIQSIDDAQLRDDLLASTIKDNKLYPQVIKSLEVLVYQ